MPLLLILSSYKLSFHLVGLFILISLRDHPTNSGITLIIFLVLPRTSDLVFSYNKNQPIDSSLSRHPSPLKILQIGDYQPTISQDPHYTTHKFYESQLHFPLLLWSLQDILSLWLFSKYICYITSLNDQEYFTWSILNG